MENALDGTVALVTGGSNGLGRATVNALVAAGAKVGVLDLADSGAHSGIPEVMTITGDVSDPATVERAFAEVTAKFGPIGILVNDAAHYPNASITEMDPDDFRKVFDVNVYGLFLTCRAFIAGVRAAGLPSGRMVHISTGSARSPRPRGAAYAASKSAVETLSATLAMEVGPEGITSNVVAPGYIDVRGWSDANPDRATDEMRVALASSIPVGRAGIPTDIANAVRFFCLPESEHINGAVLPVDGGSGAGRFVLGTQPMPEAASPAVAAK